MFTTADVQYNDRHREWNAPVRHKGDVANSLLDEDGGGKIAECFFRSVYVNKYVSGESEQPRITDLSSIQAENFKFRNTAFLMGDAEYDMEEYHSRQELRHRIWVTRNGDLRRVFYDFPFDAPLHEQCAGWMHAIAGKHFFPDANHRTALATLRKVLQDNDIVPGKWPLHVSKQTVLYSHTVRKQIDPVRLNTLYRQDRLFLVWVLYFKRVLRNVAN